MITFAIGEKASLTRKISEKDVIHYANIIGDFNPVHMDAEFARENYFGKRIVHGMILCGLISAVLGNDLPGPGAIYLSQEVRFLAPVYLEDEVTVMVEVIEWNSESGRIKLSTEIFNQESRKVLLEKLS